MFGPRVPAAEVNGRWMGAAAQRCPVRLPDGHTGRLVWVSRRGQSARVRLQDGRHQRVRIDDIVLLKNVSDVTARNVVDVCRSVGQTEVSRAQFVAAPARGETPTSEVPHGER